jgi:capsular polysaccharide biosynthesis protein
VSDTDLLAPSPSNRTVPFRHVASALRRGRRVIIAFAVIGAVAGLAFGTFGVSRSASTTVLLRYPSGSDVSQAMGTDLNLLQTRAVAKDALASLKLKTPPDTFLKQYRGVTPSDGIMVITANGPDAATATRRADAVANAFLKFRASLAQDQLDDVVTSLRAEQAALRRNAESIGAQIKRFGTAGDATTLDDLINRRAQLDGSIQQIDSTVASDTVDTDSVNASSRVIDTAAVSRVSPKKAMALNMAMGLIAGLALSCGAIVLMSVLSRKVLLRSDVAAALQAPVAVSVGPVVARRRRRFLRRKKTPRKVKNPGDLDLIVGHLQRTLAIARERSLVVVAIDSSDVASHAVDRLEKQLTKDGKNVTVIRHRKATAAAPSPVLNLPASVEEPPADVVLVLAVLDPARGAEGLREWATNAVVFVTAGRSTESTLRANAAMLRNASLDLSSVVLIDADERDDTLGLLEPPARLVGMPAEVEASTVPSVPRS